MSIYKNTSHDPNCLIILELNCVALQINEMWTRTWICNGYVLRLTTLALTHPCPSWLSHCQHLVSCRILPPCNISGPQQKCQWFSFPWWVMSKVLYSALSALSSLTPTSSLSFLSSSYPCCSCQTETQLFLAHLVHTPLFAWKYLLSSHQSLNVQNRVNFQSLTHETFPDICM